MKAVRAGWRGFIRCCLILAILCACQGRQPQTGAPSPGDSPASVQALLGAPARTQSFLLPEAPFFGPQERLTGLVPAGTPVEEWVYVQGEEEFYLWFVCDPDSSTAECGLVASARYPVGAVY